MVKWLNILFYVPVPPVHQSFWSTSDCTCSLQIQQRRFCVTLYFAGLHLKSNVLNCVSGDAAEAGAVGAGCQADAADEGAGSQQLGLQENTESGQTG